MTVTTPAGHYLGRKRDGKDTRDRMYRSARVSAFSSPPPPRVDLRSQIRAPVSDQGKFGSCGPSSGAGLMSHQYPEVDPRTFSRNQIYYCVRAIQKDTDSDDGVETRNVLKVLKKVGAATEDLWPYGAENFYRMPTANVLRDAKEHVLESYDRLSGADDYVSCLSEGHTFILGFTCYESIDSADLARTGVMPMPDSSRERSIGGHDVLVVGYESKFKQTDTFRKSGVSPELVADEMLLIRNSWGPGWGLGGHFWMPMSYAANKSIGGDAWTGRRVADAVPYAMISEQREPSEAQFKAAYDVARRCADESGYGSFVSDDKCRQTSSAVATAVVNTQETPDA